MSVWVKLLFSPPPLLFQAFLLIVFCRKQTKSCSFRPTKLTVLIAYLKSKLSRSSILQRHYTTERSSDSHGNVDGDSNLLVCYRCVTDVSRDLCASILTAKQSKQSGMPYPSNDDTRSSETSVIIYQSAWSNIRQGLNFQITKMCIILYFSWFGSECHL